ncbi:tyrosinase family protein [Rhizobium jaguaris]|uniref:Tyrosinase family protein n=1 Tax=Rhizobium jaguaris TaxID=1312183 RepID=A0A387G576_9HYPH|nr:tyrosinase family protein [Rhizobium jaguaris]AYG63082.1 tyrosinase family protein [Rhizobium jaguaris]
MDLRRNHRDLSSSQKTAFVDAVLALKNNVDSVLHPGAQKRYDDFVEVHKNAMVSGPAMIMPMPHGGPLFYPWHRILLRQFELALQTAVNDTSITLPYWDWEYSGTSNPFTPDFLGGDGDATQGGHVTTGPFAYSGGQFPIRVWDGPAGDPGLRREFGEDATSWLPTLSDISAGLAKTPYSPGPSSFERVSEGVLHNPVHRWVGGNMADATSPNDPVFFLHHAFLDLLWERWKVQHPTMPPYSPETGAKGYDLGSKLVFNARGNPSPWRETWTVKQILAPTDLGYSYA